MGKVSIYTINEKFFQVLEIIRDYNSAPLS
jgi:hypothetical protein